MKKTRNQKRKALLALSLMLAMALSLAACGASGGSTVSVSGESVTVDDLALRPDGEAGKLYENAGLKLLVPLEYDEMLQTEVPEESGDGMLFRVSEKASIEAAKAQGMETEGAGWLFSIGKIDEAAMRDLMLNTDLSGMEITMCITTPPMCALSAKAMRPWPRIRSSGLN